MNFVNVAHLHLLLNHVPTVGMVLGLGLLLLAFVRRNDHLTRASLEVFFIIALLTLPVYLSGVAAGAAIEGLSGVSEASIDAHQNEALLAFVFMQLTGLAAWLGLWQFRRASHAARWSVGAVLLLAVVTVAVVARAAAIAGQIRHPEIGSAQTVVATDATAAPESGWLTAASVTSFVTDNRWVWPAAETVHFIGLSLLLGVLLIVNLRILGAMKGVPFAAVHRLLPWGMLGYGVNLLTGMMFFIAAADQYVANVMFYWKMAFLVLAGANFLYLTVFDKTWVLARGVDARPMDKVIAASAICLWLGVIYSGRTLPFIGNAF